MNNFPDYYTLLGVTIDAPPSAIKAAFKKLALQYHPDVYKGEDAQERMRNLLLAYQTLSDSVTRKAYDARLARRLWDYASPYQGMFYVALALSFIAAAIDLVAPIITQIAIDRYTLPTNAARLSATERGHGAVTVARLPGRARVVGRYDRRHGSAGAPGARGGRTRARRASGAPPAPG